MKIEIKLNKFILKYELDLDFILIALTCPLKDYRLAYFINKFTFLKFTRKRKEYTIPSYHDDSELEFPIYKYVIDGFDTEYYLIGNRALNGGFLVPELKTTDYFILIKGFIDDEDKTELIENLNEIPDMLVASEIQPEKLKSVENLIF